MAEDAQRLEAQTYIDCLNDGLELLNRAPTGGLGGTAIKWTKDAILSDAKRYKTVKGWIHGKSRSYAAAAARAAPGDGDAAAPGRHDDAAWTTATDAADAVSPSTTDAYAAHAAPATDATATTSATVAT